MVISIIICLFIKNHTYKEDLKWEKTLIIKKYSKDSFTITLTSDSIEILTNK